MLSQKYVSYPYLLGRQWVFDSKSKIVAGSDKKVYANVSDVGAKLSIGHPGPPYRSGGGFFSKKTHTELWPGGYGSWSANSSGGSSSHYLGGFLPAVNYASSSSYIDAVSLQTASWGATGFARARPGNPTASVGQFLIELRDLPTVPLRRLHHFRDLGSEYLNVVFGWKPFVDDVRRMYLTYANLRSQLEKLVANRGKPIRRHITMGLSESSSTSRVDYTFGGSALYPGLGTVSGATSSIVTDTAIRQDFRFSGTFKYWMPDIGENLWTNRATYALFGITPTPKLLWDVLPWSWLVGWCSNVGDVLTNISSNAVDSLVADHAYVFGKHTKTDSITAEGTLVHIGGSRSTVTCAAKRVHTVSERVAASPYGFGIHSTSLDAGQIAILGALGISRIF